MPVDETPIPLDAEALEAASVAYITALTTITMWAANLRRPLADPLKAAIRAYLSRAARQQDTGAEALAALRSNGRSVAIHNDYHQQGKAMTFWLFTHPNGRWVKGEGPTDDAALSEALAAAPTPPDQGGETT